MKLLLTSNGLVNESIVNGMIKLLGKPVAGLKLAFIPTAANVEVDDKHWLIDDYNHCLRAGLELDIVDISALSADQWRPRLEQADILLFGGGNTFHLMHWMNKSRLVGLLTELLATRIYVGISAGSCIVGSTIRNPVQDLFDEDYHLDVTKGLGLVDFQIVPHLNSPYFSKIRADEIKLAATGLGQTIYALDDQSAVLVDNGQIELTSEGVWYKFN